MHKYRNNTKQKRTPLNTLREGRERFRETIMFKYKILF